jgi:hypothetical protein
MLFFSVTLFEETAAETNRYVSQKKKKTLYNMNWQSADLPYHLKREEDQVEQMWKTV